MTLVYNQLFKKDHRKELRNRMTKAEVYFWNLVQGRAIDGIKFRRQFSIDQYILDFYAPSIKLAVEIDGGYHDLPEVQEYDKRREDHIRSYDITFLRFSNDDLFQDQDGVVVRLRARIAEFNSDSLPLLTKEGG